MKKQNKVTVREIWAAIDAGKKVYWSSELYEVLVVESDLNECSEFSFRNGKALRPTHMSNWFGSLLRGKRDLNKCYITDEKRNKKFDE